ncbi:hypothetical protein VTI74DRAFT_10154 [Chaetomium olivicolor]
MRRPRPVGALHDDDDDEDEDSRVRELDASGADLHGIARQLQQLKITRFAWNPSIGTDCSDLYVYYWVYVGIQPQTSLSLHYADGQHHGQDSPLLHLNAHTPATDPPVFKPPPTAGGMPSNYSAYVQAQSGHTCRTILATYIVTEEQFLS